MKLTGVLMVVVLLSGCMGSRGGPDSEASSRHFVSQVSPGSVEPSELVPMLTKAVGILVKYGSKASSNPWVMIAGQVVGVLIDEYGDLLSSDIDRRRSAGHTALEAINDPSSPWMLEIVRRLDLTRDDVEAIHRQLDELDKELDQIRQEMWRNTAARLGLRKNWFPPGFFEFSDVDYCGVGFARDQSERPATLRIDRTEETITIGTTESGAEDTYVTIPFADVTEIQYERTESRRWPRIGFKEGKHWLTISHDRGSVHLRLDKNNQQHIRAALGAVIPVDKLGQGW